MANLVSVVSSIEVREDADISLTSHLTVRLDLLLGDFRVYCRIILNGTCNKRHMLITAAEIPSRGHISALVSYRQLQISRIGGGGKGALGASGWLCRPLRKHTQKQQNVLANQPLMPLHA